MFPRKILASDESGFGLKVLPNKQNHIVYTEKGDLPDTLIIMDADLKNIWNL